MDFGSVTALELPIQLQVLSSTPGRIRVRLGAAWQDPEVMETIVQSLTQLVPALIRVKVNPSIGTLTLYFDPGQDSGEALFERLSGMGLIALASPTSALPSAAQQLTQLTNTWNQRVNQWTQGTADLRFLLPMALALLALRRLLSNGNGLRSAPWYILAWYAFDSFLKLNPAPAVTPESPPPRAAQLPPVDPLGEASVPMAESHNGQSAKPRTRKAGQFNEASGQESSHPG